jgi:MHS family shikimate/dehydroshikimate transporter-like MFS transporter
MESTRGETNARQVVAASAIGTVIEWYDFALYGAASALVINRLFFPDTGQIVGTLAAFATFAVGFFARPLGGFVVANYGDKVGRKPALVFTVALIGLSTVLIGALPAYDAIGVWAPALLVLLRLA